MKKKSLHIIKTITVGKTHFFTASDYLQYKRVHNKAAVLKRKAHVPITLLKHFPKERRAEKKKGAVCISRSQKPQLVLKLKQEGDSPCSPQTQEHLVLCLKVVMHSTWEKKIDNRGKDNNEPE